MFSGLLALLLLAPPCGAHAAPGSMLVTAPWLAQHLHDAGLVLLAVNVAGTAAIPGARPLDYHAIQDLPPARLAQAFAALGVGPAARVVLYYGPAGFGSAARVFVALDSIGYPAAVLDGGIGAWREAGLSLATRPPPLPPPALPSSCAAPDVLVDTAWLQTRLHAPGMALIDARPAPVFAGITTQSQQERAGHIPGAVNLPYTLLVDARDRLRPPSDLRALLAAAGAHPGDRIVAYCRTGHQASALYFAARLLGFDVRLYAGSWAEWSRNPLLPAALSPPARQ